MKSRILIYNSDLNLATFVYKLGEHLVKQNHRVTFMGHSNYWFGFSENGISYYPLPYSSQTAWLLLSTMAAFFKLSVIRPSAILSVFRTIKEDYQKNKGIKGGRNWLLDFIRLGACQMIKPDLIHNQNSPALASLEPLFDHYPIVQSLHGKLEDFSPYFDQKIASVYQQFFPKISGFQSDSSLSWQNAQKFGTQTDNVYISYSLSENKWLKTPKGLEHRNDHLKITTVGKLIWKKGFLYALEAMNLLMGELKFTYQIIGGGDPTEVRFHIEDLNLNDQVKLVNHLPHDQIFREIRESDLFLLPSLQEGFATVVTEAMTLGVPVISTNCSGMPELLKDRYNALLVSPRDPQAIAKAILNFSQMSSNEIAQITTNAQSLVKQRLLWEDQIHNYIRLYENSLN